MAALGILLATASAAVADHPCPGHPLATVELRGCDAATCKSHGAIRRVLATLPFAPGDATPIAELDLARVGATLVTARLVSTTPRWSCDDERQALVIEVAPQTFVRRVTLRGNDAFRKKELLKRVFLRPGTPLTLDPAAPEENEDVARQVDSLLRLYRQAGLDTARIQVDARAVSPTELDLELVIAEGPRARIDTVVARHVRTRAQADSQCSTISARRLERLTGVETGDVVTRLTERQVRERLRQAFQAAGWVRPRIAVTPAADEPGRLEVVVETDHCWLVRVWQRDLARARDDGLSFRWTDPVLADGAAADGTLDGAPFTRAPLDEWSAVLPFGESGSFDRDEAARGVATMAREVRARGFPFAEVTMRHRELGRGGEALGVIDYFVTLNLPRRVTAIRFEGNATFDDERLSAVMKSQAYDFFGSPGAFDEARALADLAELRRFYVARGFLQMRFGDRADGGGLALARDVVSAREGEIVWRYAAGDLGFRVAQRASEPHLTLHIAIDEGPRTRVASLDVTGATLLTPARVAELTGLGPGRPFGSKPLGDARDALRRFYQRRGHHRVTLDVACRVGAGDAAREVPCEPEALVAQGDVALTIAIAEGPAVRVGAVIWRGNSETDPHVLVRDLPRAGDILDLARIDRAVRRMRALGIFNSVRVDVIGLEAGAQAAPDAHDGAHAEEVTLLVSVEEANYRFLDLAAGVRSIQRANIGRVPRWAADGAGTLVDQADRLTTGFGRAFALDIPDLLFTTEVEYVDLDVGGIGNQLRIPFTAGFSLSQFLRLATFDPSLTFPRIYDSSVTLTTRIIAELDRVTDPLDRLELGAEADVSVPLSDEMLAGVTARAGVIQLEAPDDACVYCLAGPPVGWSTALPHDLADEAATEASCDGDEDDPACADASFRPQLTLTLRWRWDRQDTPLHPTRGTVLAASTSFILDRDRESSSPRFNQFLKWEASLRGAASFGPVVLAGFFRYGAAATFDERFLPLDERYTLGGSNGLRGFVDNGVCRYEPDGSLKADCAEEFGGNVVLSGSLELRVPLLEESGLWLGTFLDVGALAERHEELYASSFRWGAGIGLRFLLGGLFPIRLDFGFPVFERRCIATTADGACVREETSQVHFDLLYTF
ncbi:MAG: BamA/TamA family outer membrane protein [Deltaproteobacteria bacterium]|nr:BamA/TamA family outer membrane protein [Deltaproteobacteria bacterium]